MILSIARRKGGSGKTSVAAGLALALQDKSTVHVFDCDVEEPNTHIFLHPDTAPPKPARRTPGDLMSGCGDDQRQ